MARPQKGWDTWSVFCLLIVGRCCSFDTVPSRCCLSSTALHLGGHLLPATKWLLTAQPSSPQVLWPPAFCPSPPVVLPPPSLDSQTNKGQQQNKPLLEAGPYSQIIFVPSVSRRISLFPVIAFKIKIFWSTGHGCRKRPSRTIHSQCTWDEWRSQEGARRLLPNCYSPAEREENGIDLQRAPNCKAVKPNKIQITQSLIQK